MFNRRLRGEEGAHGNLLRVSELPGGRTLAGLLEGDSGSKTQRVGAEPCLDPALSCVPFLLQPQIPWEQVTSTAPMVQVLRHPEVPSQSVPPPSPRSAPSLARKAREISGSRLRSPSPFFC